MTLVSPTQITDGTTGDASDVNTPINQLAAVINGNVDNANISASAAIDSSKISFTTSGLVVQVKSTNYSAVSTGTATIPLDDTIPQITEGTEFMTQTITPKSATNRLRIEVKVMASLSINTANIIGGLFQDSTANALAADHAFQGTATAPVKIHLVHDMVAGTTSSTTFRVRLGGNSASTVTFNGQSGARLYGGVTLSTITITEYIP